MGGEHSADGCRGVGPAKLEDHVVAGGTRGDALLGVVDHVIGTEAPHYVDVTGAADPGDERRSAWRSGRRRSRPRRRRR